MTAGKGSVKVIVVIPARYGSSRFAGKVVADQTGKFLVQHTYERALCAKTVDEVLIATDSDKVLDACKSFGCKCVMTSAEHVSGTDRIAEAAGDIEADIVINLQDDEPEIAPECIDQLAGLLKQDPSADMATLAAPFDSVEEIADPNIVKVVVDGNGRALYFSRSIIPYDRAAGGAGRASDYLRHLGIYAYRKDFLLKYAAMPQTALEKCEKLEQLRAIENGFTIITGIVEHGWPGIDTAEQYAAFVQRYAK